MEENDGEYEGGSESQGDGEAKRVKAKYQMQHSFADLRTLAHPASSHLAALLVNILAFRPTRDLRR